MIAHLHRRSSLEAMLVVPAQGTWIWTLTDVVGNNDPLTLKCIVMLAVFELLPNTPADLESEVWRDGYVARV
jgi:hypothetical protein